MECSLLFVFSFYYHYVKTLHGFHSEIINTLVQQLLMTHISELKQIIFYQFRKIA